MQLNLCYPTIRPIVPHTYVTWKGRNAAATRRKTMPLFTIADTRGSLAVTRAFSVGQVFQMPSIVPKNADTV